MITTAALEFRDSELGGVGRKGLHVRIGCDERCADILRHGLGVAADIELGAIVQPIDEVAAPLPETMLHVDLLRRVTREGEVELRQRSVLQRILPFELIQEVVRVAPVAEEQPGSADRADRHAVPARRRGRGRCPCPGRS